MKIERGHCHSFLLNKFCLFPIGFTVLLLTSLPGDGVFFSPGLVYAENPTVEGSLLRTEVEGNPREQVPSVMRQLNFYQKQLEESERRLQEFQQKHKIIVLETQITLLLEQGKSLDESLNDAKNRAVALKEKLSWVKSQISQVPSQVPLSSTSREQGIIIEAKNNLLALRLKEQQLLTKYTENSPHVQSLRREIALINEFIKDQEAQLGDSVTTGKNPLYHAMEMKLFETEAELVFAEAKSRTIIQQIADVDKELARLRSLRPERDELRRQVIADEKNYVNYAARVGTNLSQDYQIQVGDQLDIKFFFNPELNESVSIRPDGRIALQLVGELSVVGKTVEEIRAILINKYSQQLKNPEVAVFLRSFNSVGTEIGGIGNTR